MVVKTRPCVCLSFGKQLNGYMFISITFVALQSSMASYSIAHSLGDDNQTNQILPIESTVPADNETIINSTTQVSSNQMSSFQPPVPLKTTTTTSEPTITQTTLPPPLPTPLPSKGHPKLYSGSSQLLFLDNQLKSKESYLGRTKRMKRSRPNIIKTDSASGNPFSLIKYLLTNHLTSPNDYPMSYPLIDSKPGQFGSIYSSNIEDSLDRNDFSPGSFMNNIHSRVNPEQSASFYPLTANDIEALELSEGDDTFDAGFGGDGWNNQGTIDLINQMEVDGSNGNNNNNVDLYSLDPFIPLRSFRSSPTSSRSHSGLLMRPIISMKRKRRPNNSYPFNEGGVERSTNSIILGTSLFGGDNHYRSRSNNNQYEQLINRIKDNPTAYL